MCAIPAWRALRTAFPKANITLIGLPWAQSFVERFNRYLDGFIEFPGIPGFPEREPRLHEFPAFLAEVQRRRFDLALQMQGSGSISNTLTALFGARLTAGFSLPEVYCPDPDRFLTYPDHGPEVHRHLALMRFLGIPSQGADLEFPLLQEDWAALEALRASLDAGDRIKPGQYVCIHPGARALDRRWSPERFAAVADALAGQGLQPVLTGTAGERHLAEQVLSHMRAPALNLAGRTSLGALCALLCGARLLVCNDTGVSHLAAALKLPSVVLFLASEPERWAPLDAALHRPILAASAPASRVIFEAMDLLVLARPGLEKEKNNGLK